MTFLVLLPGEVVLRTRFMGCCENSSWFLDGCIYDAKANAIDSGIIDDALVH